MFDYIINIKFNNNLNNFVVLIAEDHNFKPCIIFVVRFLGTKKLFSEYMCTH